MSNLTQIERRHRRDTWKDVCFLFVAALVIAVSIGAVTSRGAGKPLEHEWTVTVIEGAVELSQ